MGILRAVWWTLATGRDRDVAPPVNWWRGPAWIRWTLLVGVLGWWGTRTFLVWRSATDGSYLLAGLLVVLQVSAPLLSRYRPLTAVRIALLASAVAMVVVHPISHPITPVHLWPLDAYLLPFTPVIVSAIVRSRAGEAVGVAAAALGLLVCGSALVGLEYGLGVMTGPLLGGIFVVVIGYALRESRQAKQETGAEREKRAALQERNRIARELHDVIGHHLSMIAVRTDSAPYRLANVDEPTRAEFVALGAAARSALDEARRLLGVLREDDGEAERVPQPTINDIPELVRRSWESGADVQLSVRGETSGVPTVVGLAAYRIVQESLSNALRHSPGVRVDVQMDCADKEIELSVDNEPAGVAVSSRGDGTGLAGIRERVSLVGGSCTVGPRPDGGFRVWVRLPR